MDEHMAGAYGDAPWSATPAPQVPVSEWPLCPRCTMPMHPEELRLWGYCRDCENELMAVQG